MDRQNKSSFLLIPAGNQIKGCLIIPKWKDGKQIGYITAINIVSALPLDSFSGAENKGKHKEGDKQ